MQIASSPSFLGTISQILNPVQGTTPLKTQTPKAKDGNTALASASDANKSTQTQSAPPTTSTRRGSNVNLVV